MQGVRVTAFLTLKCLQREWQHSKNKIRLSVLLGVSNVCFRSLSSQHISSYIHEGKLLLPEPSNQALLVFKRIHLFRSLGWMFVVFNGTQSMYYMMLFHLCDALVSSSLRFARVGFITLLRDLRSWKEEVTNTCVLSPSDCANVLREINETAGQ